MRYTSDRQDRIENSQGQFVRLSIIAFLTRRKWEYGLYARTVVHINQLIAHSEHIPSPVLRHLQIMFRRRLHETTGIYFFKTNIETGTTGMTMIFGFAIATHFDGKTAQAGITKGAFFKKSQRIIRLYHAAIFPVI